MTKFDLNGKSVSVEVPGDTSLLWTVREELGLTGSKFGCGKGLCGACTMHLNGQAIRTCVMPVAGAAGQKITTIEGLGSTQMHAVQKAWIENNVPQCGYCQSGQIMQAVSYINSVKEVTEDSMRTAMSGNICRCGTYPRIRKAIFEAAKALGKKVVE